MSTMVVASAITELDILLEIVCVKLQLSQSQFNEATEHYRAVSDWLLADKSNVQENSPEIYPQGSFNLGTVVKPFDTNEFDLDFVCELQLPVGTRPSAVYKAILSRMRENERYTDILEPMPRCIRLTYASGFHLDIVPAIPDPGQSGNQIFVPDIGADLELEQPVDDEWKPSNPKGYKEWFKSHCVQPVTLEARASAEPIPDREPAHKKPALKRAVQLLKRWRDVAYQDRREVEPTSIILTTLSSHFYGREPLASDSLNTILDRVCKMRAADRFDCQYNPANPKENICDRWIKKPNALSTFDREISKFRVDWERLLKTTGIHNIAAELKRIFGEYPVNDAIIEFSKHRIDGPRSGGSLVMDRSTGKIGTATTAAASTSSMPVRDTSFYGK